MQNSSNTEIFHTSKVEYETALKNIWYESIGFKYDTKNNQNNRRNRQRNILRLHRYLAKQCQKLLQKICFR